MIKWDKPCYKCLSHFCDLSCKEPKHLQAPQRKEPEQEPVKMVAYNCTCGRTMKFESVHGVVAPQRTWVGLDDDERNDCLVSADPCEALAEPEARQLMEDVEAKLKEKNT